MEVTEYRVGYSRVDQKHGRRISYEHRRTLDAAERLVAYHETIDRDGLDGIPVGNKLTVRPFIEQRTVSPWTPTSRADRDGATS